MNENKIKNSIQELIEMFKTNNMPRAISFAINPRLDVPSNKWSLSNRIIQVLHDTDDSRGFRQWKDAQRTVKKNAKAFYIFAPRIQMHYECICEKILSQHEINLGACEKCNEKIVIEDIKTFTSFIAVPVFRSQDTQGKPLDYETLPVPNHRFIDVAKSWGISIKSTAFSGIELGHYKFNKEIVLASPDEMVFYHELAHAAHDRLCLLDKSKDKIASNEIVAEFSALVLCYMDNKSCNKIGSAYSYLSQYAKAENKTVEKAVMKLLGEIEKVLNLILDSEKKLCDIKLQSESNAVKIAA
jgi:hypothetical protein